MFSALFRKSVKSFASVSIVMYESLPFSYMYWIRSFMLSYCSSLRALASFSSSSICCNSACLASDFSCKSERFLLRSVSCWFNSVRYASRSPFLASRELILSCEAFKLLCVSVFCCSASVIFFCVAEAYTGVMVRLAIRNVKNKLVHFLFLIF